MANSERVTLMTEQMFHAAIVGFAYGLDMCVADLWISGESESAAEQLVAEQMGWAD